jgi:hypothetical protein
VRRTTGAASAWYHIRQPRHGVVRDQQQGLTASSARRLRPCGLLRHPSDWAAGCWSVARTAAAQLIPERGALTLLRKAKAAKDIAI